MNLSALKSTLEFRIAAAAVDIGRAIRVKINNMPIPERAKPATSILKPDAKDRARLADAEGEKIGCDHLEVLSSKLGYDIHLIVEPGKGVLHNLGKNKGNKVIFAYLDAVDGTVKVAGLGNDSDSKIYRLANDGAWGSGIAFTLPTAKTVDQLAIGDFQIAAIVDGNPAMYKTSPREVIAFPYQGKLTSFDWNDRGLDYVFTSTTKQLSQSMVYLDSFQAYDRQSRKVGDEQWTNEIYGKLINRNDKGAFDVLRQYGNLSALIKNMLGWKNLDFSYEPQCTAFLAINENLPNMLPAVPIVLGAGGLALDFDGDELATRKLIDGRTNIIYSANNSIAMHILKLVHRQ